MAKKSDLETGLRTMAEDFVLPGGGHVKLARLVTMHLNWFDTATERGMTWLAMTKALAIVGITNQRGKPLSVSMLSATVWRARELRSQAPSRIQKPEPLAARPALKKARSKNSEPQLKPKLSIPPKPAQTDKNKSTSTNEDLLNYMQRAAALRKGQNR
jgi:hypothetical protein